MLHQREGGEKISSPHLVEAFWDQKPPKMGMCDLDWIIILLVRYLDAFQSGKSGGISSTLSLRNIFTSGAQFGKLGLETFRECFEAPNDIFWGKSLLL